MLIIRKEQLHALQITRRQIFEDEMRVHLRRQFARRPVVDDDDRLRTLVREGIDVAARYGIEIVYDVRRFLEFSAELGPDFHTLPWVMKILNDPTLSGCGKMEQLDARSLFVARR